MDLFLFLSQLLNGLLDGFYYLLIAIGLSLIFSLGGIVNLAHGAFFAIGAYLAIAVSPHTGFFGAVIVVPLMVAGLGMVTERLLFTRFYRVDPLYSLLLTFGLAMVVEQSLRWMFGSAPLAYNIPDALRGQVFLGDFIYSRYRIFLIVVAILAVGALWFLLNRTANGTWTAPEASGTLNTPVADLIARTMILLPYTGTTQAETDMSVYGFVPTAGLTVEFVLTDGTTHGIVVGFRNPTETGYYAAVDNRAEIYILERAAVDFLISVLRNPPIA